MRAKLKLNKVQDAILLLVTRDPEHSHANQFVLKTLNLGFVLKSNFTIYLLQVYRWVGLMWIKLFQPNGRK